MYSYIMFSFYCIASAEGVPLEVSKAEVKRQSSTDGMNGNGAQASVLSTTTTPTFSRQTSGNKMLASTSPPLSLIVHPSVLTHSATPSGQSSASSSASASASAAHVSPVKTEPFVPASESATESKSAPRSKSKYNFLIGLL